MQIDGHFLSVLMDWLWAPISFVLGLLFNHSKKVSDKVNEINDKVNEHKLHVSETYATKSEISEMESRILREMDKGFRGLKELLEAKIK